MMIFGRIVARQQDIINGSDLRPYLVMSSKEVDLLRAHPIIAYQGRADASANLDEDVLAGADSSDFLRRGAVGQHSVEKVGQGHTASQRLNSIKIRSCYAQRFAKAQEQLVAADFGHEFRKQEFLHGKIRHTGDSQRV